jgi:hypothetical protein
MMPTRPSRYERFYVRARSRSPLVFSAGRLAMWCARKVRRYPAWTAAYLALFAGLAAVGFWPAVGAYGPLFWLAAGPLVVAGLVAVSAGNAGLPSQIRPPQITPQSSASHAAYPTPTSLQSAIDQKEDRFFSILLANSKPRLGTYIALAQAIQDAGHLAVVVVRPDVLPSAEELLGFESVDFASVPIDAVKRLQGVDLFFSPEVVTDVAPEGSVTICIPHSLPDGGLRENTFASNTATLIWRYPTIIRSFDYLVAAVRQHPDHWTESNHSRIQRIYPPHFLAGRRRFLDIVPGGYPKLDYSRRILNSSSAHRCIIYSPTSFRSSQSRVRRDAKAILSALLQAFPHLTVVFRPYPSEVDLRDGRRLADRFATSPRFAFDANATGVRYQRECAVAVTDSSSSAITFSLATRRPLVFVDLKDSDPSSGASAPLAPVRNPFGFTAHSVTAMVAAVRSGIDNPALWQDVIMEAAEKHIYNPGSAARYLATHLQWFANRESHPDWLSIERRPWIGTGEEGEVERHLHRLRRWADRAPSGHAPRMYDEIAEHLQAGSQAGHP